MSFPPAHRYNLRSGSQYLHVCIFCNNKPCVGEKYKLYIGILYRMAHSCSDMNNQDKLVVCTNVLRDLIGSEFLPPCITGKLLQEFERGYVGCAE